MRILIYLLFSLLFSNPLYSFQRDHFTDGKKLTESGAFVQALEEWEKGKFFHEQNGLCDPRIGRAYIETVTENDLKDKYEKASDFYTWGVSGEAVAEGRDEIFSEAERIVPLLGNDEAEKWNELIKKKDISLKDKIRGFWIRNDPTPTTPYNERLIEHWERIAYSRKTFTKNRLSIYNCDDRGMVYVKLGEPFQKRWGNLGTDQTELYKWAGDIADLINDGKHEPKPPTAPEIRATTMDIAKKVREYDIFPEYEIWSYKFEYTDEPTFYIFGLRDGNGAFGLRKSIEEFIQSRSYRRTNRVYVRSSRLNGALITPGALVQLNYYENLHLLGGVFEERYNDLCMTWRGMFTSGKIPNHDVMKSYHDTFENRDVDDFRVRYVPESISDVEESIEKVNIITTQLRMLDDENRPKLALVAMSFPEIQGGFSVEDIIAGKELKQDYNLTHTLKIHDGNWNELNRITDEKKEGSDNTSVFVLDHNTGSNNYILAAEAVSKDPALAANPHIGKIIIDPVEPLNADYSQLEISDIITGVLVPESFKSTDYPFPVIPAERIHLEDPFMVYIEAYHLMLAPDGKAHFEIEFAYDYWKKRRFGVKKEQHVSQKFPFETEGTTAKEMAGFDISDLYEGEYEFTITVTDRTSGQKKSRTGKIRIIEEKEK
ncbi:GWxTD domain-containing protein [candidate division KSB1 bacterium]